MPTISGLEGWSQRMFASSSGAFLLYMEGLNEKWIWSRSTPSPCEDAVAGRLELFGDQVYLDGAHNPHAMLRLIEFANSLAGSA